MSGARDQILDTIRKGRGRGAVMGAARSALEARLGRRRRGTIPARVDKDAAALTDLFVEQAEALSVTVDRVGSVDDVPEAVAGYLARENLPAMLRAAPDPLVESAPWESRPALTVSSGPSDGGDEVGLTGAFAAVAETGTLVLRSGPTHPTTLNFLPDTHIVLLRTSQVVGPYEDAWDRLRAAGALPRTVNFVSGPSRTADIEQTIQLGAHGPRRLHIVLIDDAGGDRGDSRDTQDSQGRGDGG
ncbi:MAG: lactate utilization protein [Alphaproteobacteria bacterium]|nr:lactate utilization protein [Alphaproteobacteria bacterium]